MWQKVETFKGAEYFRKALYIWAKKTSGLWSVYAVTGNELHPTYTSKCCRSRSIARVSSLWWSSSADDV